MSLQELQAAVARLPAEELDAFVCWLEGYVRTGRAGARGAGLLRTEGALADDTEWDAIMEEIYQARKLERHPPVPDLGGP